MLDQRCNLQGHTWQLILPEMHLNCRTMTNHGLSETGSVSMQILPFPTITCNISVWAFFFFFLETHRQKVPWARDTHLLSQRDVRASLRGHGSNVPCSLLSSPRFYLHSLGKVYVAVSSTCWCLIKTSRISRTSCVSRDTLCLIYLVNWIFSAQLP